jgi:hypothetical protein
MADKDEVMAADQVVEREYKDSEKASSSAGEPQPPKGHDEAEEARILRKVDFRLLPLLTLLYLLSFMDRGNSASSSSFCYFTSLPLSFY